MPTRPGVAKINGVPLGISEFRADVNRFVDDFNRRSRSASKAAAIGYLLAGFTAIASAWLSAPRLR